MTPEKTKSFKPTLNKSHDLLSLDVRTLLSNNTTSTVNRNGNNSDNDHWHDGKPPWVFFPIFLMLYLFFIQANYLRVNHLNNNGDNGDNNHSPTAPTAVQQQQQLVCFFYLFFIYHTNVCFILLFLGSYHYISMTQDGDDDKNPLVIFQISTSWCL